VLWTPRATPRDVWRCSNFRSPSTCASQSSRQDELTRYVVLVRFAQRRLGLVFSYTPPKCNDTWYENLCIIVVFVCVCYNIIRSYPKTSNEINVSQPIVVVMMVDFVQTPSLTVAVIDNILHLLWWYAYDGNGRSCRFPPLKWES
jgi:hypothetical protein